MANYFRILFPSRPRRENSGMKTRNSGCPGQQVPPSPPFQALLMKPFPTFRVDWINFFPSWLFPGSIIPVFQTPGEAALAAGRTRRLRAGLEEGKRLRAPLKPPGIFFRGNSHIIGAFPAARREKGSVIGQEREEPPLLSFLRHAGRCPGLGSPRKNRDSSYLPCRRGGAAFPAGLLPSRRKSCRLINSSRPVRGEECNN